jgi:hypothetical protein
MPPIPSRSGPKLPKSPIPKSPKPKPKSRDPATKSRVSPPLRRMSDPAPAAAASTATATAAAGSGAAASGSGAIVHPGGGGAWPRGVRFGDMVWGKVKSHPWWPGHVYSITLTSDGEVRRGYRDGLVLVAFFGDSSYGWFEPHELLPFEEHFREKFAQPGGRNFPTAIDEAADEVARRAALAFLCPCHRPNAARPHELDPRYLLVDVPGFDTDAEYHPEQVAAEREKIDPRALLDYLKGAAVEQLDAAELIGKPKRHIPAVQMSSMLEAYRLSRYALKDPTYAQAFGMDYDEAQAAKTALEKKAREGILTRMPNPINPFSCAVCYYAIVSAAMYSNMLVKLTVIPLLRYRLKFDSFVLNRSVDLVQLVFCFIFLLICLLHDCCFIGVDVVCHTIIIELIQNEVKFDRCIAATNLELS